MSRVYRAGGRRGRTAPAVLDATEGGSRSSDLYALALATKVDRVVLVTHAEHTQRGHLKRAKDELDKSGASTLGVLLNGTAPHAPPWLQRRLSL